MSTLPGTRVAVFAVIALMIFSGLAIQSLANPASSGVPHTGAILPQAALHTAQTVTATAPARSSTFDPRALLNLHPLAGLPSASFSSLVGAFTTDPLVANNTGINTTITLPTSFNPPAKGCLSFSSTGFSGLVCAFLGVEEPFNATSTAAIGCAITEVTVAGVQTLHVLPVAILPNGTFIYSSSSTGLTLGQSHTFSILHSNGKWWEFEYDLTPITGNGTYNLNATEALGLSGGSLGAPVELMAEFGNSSFMMPEVEVPRAIGIELNGTSSTSYQPVSGNAILLNASYPIGIQGHVQLASIPLDSVNEGGVLTFPGVFASLWGNYKPLGILTPQAGAYTDESAASGNTGIGLTVTVPTTSEPTGTADLLGVQMPVNGTIEIGVGVAFVGTLASPYYTVRDGFNTSTYVSRTQIIPSGTSLALKASVKGGGWWSFTENGNLIVNATTGPGNGTAYLGLNAASAYLGATYAPNTSYFAESTFPMLALYGNGTMSLVNAPVGMQFQLPGRGWMIPDYAYGYSWNMSVGEQSQLPSPSTLARGDVNLGSSVGVVTTNPPLLWKGELSLNDAQASPASVISGQNSTIRVNLTSGMAAPSNGNICAVPSTAPAGTSCGAMTFTAGVSGSNWTVYSGAFVAPTLTSTTPLTVTFAIQATPSPPVYVNANTVATLAVTAPVLKVQVHANPSTVTAGATSTIDVWVNDTLGGVSGVQVNATPSVPNLGAVATATSTAGLYTDTFAPLISITTQTTYQVTFFANMSGTVGGTGSLSITAVPLPQLTVQVVASSGSATVVGGVQVIFNVTVTSPNGTAESGAHVALVVNPSSSSWSGTTTGVTGPGGLLELELTAPSVTTTTAFNVSATATLGGFRGGSGQAVVNVKSTSGPAPNSSGLGILLYVIIGAVVAAAAVAVLLLMRKKKPSPSAGQENNPSEPGTEGQGAPDAQWEQPSQQS